MGDGASLPKLRLLRSHPVMGTACFLAVFVILSIVNSTLSLTSMSSSGGPVLGVKGLSRWAVVGDVTNPAKPAFRVAARLQDSGRTVYRVSPYLRKEPHEEGLYRQLSDIATEVDAVNLIVSPRIGISVLEEMARRNIQYCFIQPGADAPSVLTKAKELGIIVQQGCVLVQPLPPLE